MPFSLNLKIPKIVANKSTPLLKYLISNTHTQLNSTQRKKKLKINLTHNSRFKDVHNNNGEIIYKEEILKIKKTRYVRVLTEWKTSRGLTGWSWAQKNIADGFTLLWTSSVCVCCLLLYVMVLNFFFRWIFLRMA